MKLETLLQQYRPGSYDWTWEEEFAEIRTRYDPDYYRLALDILTNGMKEPVLLGDDGRVWDGHTRLEIADLHGIEEVPTVYAKDLQEKNYQWRYVGKPLLLTIITAAAIAGWIKRKLR